MRLRTALATVVLVATALPATTARSASAASCTVSHVLRWGSRRAEVTCLEQALVDHGLSVVGPDDYLGMSTSAALRSFQTANGLAPDAMADEATTAALGIAAPDAGPSGDHLRNNDVVQSQTIGYSVEGRPITAIERGTPGGKVVLVFGVIHGNERDGHKIVDVLENQPVPPGVDLWIVPSMNPDGEAHDIRQNAHLVDLNRNFPYNWGRLGSAGYWQYAGPSPASEPETQAAVALIDRLAPAITIWYHQDAKVVGPSGADVNVYRTYAQMVGLPIDEVVGGTYTGTATQYTNHYLPSGTAFIVELPGQVTGWMGMVHASAVLAVSQR